MITKFGTSKHLERSYLLIDIEHYKSKPVVYLKDILKYHIWNMLAKNRVLDIKCIECGSNASMGIAHFMEANTLIEVGPKCVVFVCKDECYNTYSIMPKLDKLPNKVIESL